MRRRLIFGYRTHTYCGRGCVGVGEVRVTAHRVEVDLAPDSGGRHELVRRATTERNVEFFRNDGREAVELRKRLRWPPFHQRLGLRWLRDLQLRLRLSRATDVLSAANQQHKGRNYEPDSGPSATCRHLGRCVTAIQFQTPHHFAEGQQSVLNSDRGRIRLRIVRRWHSIRCSRWIDIDAIPGAHSQVDHFLAGNGIVRRTDHGRTVRCSRAVIADGWHGTQHRRGYRSFQALRGSRGNCLHSRPRVMRIGREAVGTDQCEPPGNVIGPSGFGLFGSL